MYGATAGSGLPALTFETSAMWFDLSSKVIAALLPSSADAVGADAVGAVPAGAVPGGLSETASRAVRRASHAASHALVKMVR